MNKVDFDHCWDRFFQPMARQLRTRYRFVALGSTTREEVWEAFRFGIQDYYRPDGSRDHRRTAMDRHIIAAIFVHAALRTLPIRVPTGRSRRTAALGERLANEAWAWGCAQKIVLFFIRRYATEKKNGELMDLFARDFDFPPVGSGHYAEYAIRLLARNRRRGTYEIHSFAHILFFVEKYTMLSRGPREDSFAT